MRTSLTIRNIRNRRNNLRKTRSSSMKTMMLGRMANKSVIAIGLIKYLSFPLRPWYFCDLPQSIRRNIYSAPKIKKMTNSMGFTHAPKCVWKIGSVSRTINATANKITTDSARSKMVDVSVLRGKSERAKYCLIVVFKNTATCANL